MGGQGSGRRPDPIKNLMGFDQPSGQQPNTLYLPNMGAVKPEALKDSSTDISSNWTTTGNDIYNSNTGNVGIGTTSPDGKLDVTDGNAQFVFESASSDKPYLQSFHNAIPGAGDEIMINYIQAYDSTSVSTTYAAISAYADNPTNAAEDGGLAFGTMNNGAFSTNIRIKDGNVGIGTTSPSNLLHVSKASANTKVRIGNNGAYDQLVYFNGNADWSVGMDYSNSNAFTIASTSSLDSAQRLVINSAGNVGIGTVSPDTKLQVVGTTKFGDDNTNYMTTAADGELTLVGTARVEKCVTIRVGGFKAPGANPADLIDLGIAQAFAFDPTTQEYISTEITLPVDMDITVAPTLVANWSAAATTGTAVWQMEYLYRSSNEDMTAAAQETLRGESTPSGTANGLVREELTGIDLPSATDKILLVRISRDTSDGTYTDDMAGDAHLSAIKLCYTSNKLGDST